MNDERMTIDAGSWGATFPQSLSALIGRETELGTVVALLDRPDVRLVTLTGSGGVGKTRLAIEVGKRVARSFSSGAVFVDLAVVTDPIFVASAIVQTLGVADMATPPDERLETVLAHRQQLLVLDNFEQVIDAAPLIVRLISVAPGLKVLASSRIRLRVTPEIEYAVPPLALPTGNESGEMLGEIASVQLFVERALAVDPGFVLSTSNEAGVMDICRRLDGLPLAIELAVPKLKVLPLAALAARLDHQLPVLAGGSRDWPERQQSMRRTIAWSYDLLQPAEQRLLRWLSVFVGGCSWEAVEATGSAIGLDAAGIVEAISALVDGALMRSVHGSGNVPRFQMPEPIKDFAIEALDASDELRAAQEGHANAFLNMIERGGPIFGPLHLARVQEADRESANLHAALDWWIADGRVERSLRLANAMAFTYWTARGRFQLQRIWMVRVLAMQTAGLEALCAGAWVRLGWAEWVLGNLAAARYAAAKGLANSQMCGHDAGAAWALGIMGLLDSADGNYAAARGQFDAALGHARSAGDSPLESIVSSWLGFSYFLSGDFENARYCYEQGLAILQEVHDPWTMADAQLDLAFALRKLGRYRESAQLLREALWRELEFGDDYMMSSCLDEAAGSAVALGRFEDAALLLGASAHLRARSEIPVQETTLEEYSNIVEGARSRLGEQEFAAAWLHGETSSLEDVAAVTDRVLAGWEALADGAESEAANTYGLSRREREVLQLLVTGNTNREIAEILFISVPTVKVHVGSILNKLGLESRTAAAAFAVQHRLT